MPVFRKLFLVILLIVGFQTSDAQSLSSINVQIGFNLYSFDQSLKTGAGSLKYGYYSFNKGLKIGIGAVFNINSDFFRLENNLLFFRDNLTIQKTRLIQPNNRVDLFNIMYTNNILQDQLIFIISDRKNSFNLRLGFAIDLVLKTFSTDFGYSNRGNGDQSFIYGGQGDRSIYYQLGPLFGISYGRYNWKWAFDYLPGITPRYITGSVDPNHPYFPGSNDPENWEGQKMVRNMWTFTVIVNIYQLKEKKK